MAGSSGTLTLSAAKDADQEGISGDFAGNANTKVNTVTVVEAAAPLEPSHSRSLMANALGRNVLPIVHRLR
jgi:hypothetical protein